MNASYLSQAQKTAAVLIKRSSSGQLELNPRAAARALLLSEDTYATILFLLACDAFGAEFLGQRNEDGSWDEPWHPTTIRMELEKEFGLILPPINLSKIVAAITLVTTNYFYRDVRKFIDICNILSGDDFSPGTFDPANAAEIIWGVSEAMLLYPADDDKEDTEFSPEIRGYIAEVLKADGIASAPDVLKLGAESDASQHIQTNFSDDPEMFAAIWKVQQAKNSDLTDMVKENFREMLVQLRVLPLNQGSKEGLLRQIQHVVGELPQDTSESSN